MSDRKPFIMSEDFPAETWDRMKPAIEKASAARPRLDPAPYVSDYVHGTMVGLERVYLQYERSRLLGVMFIRTCAWGT